MKSSPRITAIIPTWNRADLLARAIESVLAQTYSDFRILILDNASEDDTREVATNLSKQDGRVEYHRHPANIGAVANYNFGLRTVETEFFSLLADDDMLLPDFYCRGVEALQLRSEAGFFAAPTLIRDEIIGAERLQGMSWRAGFHEPGIDSTLAMIREHFITTGVIFRASVKTILGELNRWGSDRSYMILAAARVPFLVSDETGAILNIHPDSISGGSDSSGLRLDTEYLLSVHDNLREELEATVLSQRDAAALSHELAGRFSADVLFVVLTKSYPAGRFEEIREICKQRERFGLSRGTTLLLRALLAGSRFGRLHRWSVVSSRRLHVIMIGLREWVRKAQRILRR